jgi:hypothetical protein
MAPVNLKASSLALVVLLSPLVATAADPPASCCTAEAMKTLAAQSAVVDMVGVKLGMTPAQATAVLKAHNSALKTFVVNERLVRPGVPNFVPVPHYIVATNNPPGRPLQTGQEVILLEFSTPPNAPPLLTVASRYANFPPTLAGNLTAEMDKKYGPEYPPAPNSNGQMRVWVYDQSGKPVTSRSPVIDRCTSSDMGPMGQQRDFAAQNANQPDPNGTRELSAVSYKNAQVNYAPAAECTPYSWVKAHSLFTTQNPDTQLIQILVSVTSGGLNYAAFRSTSDWLQGEAQARAQAQQNAAGARTGPGF